MSNKDRFLYKASLKAYRDNISIVRTAKNEGIEIGEVNKEQYADEKAKEKQLGMAENCLEDGIGIAKTAKLTGLTEEEIRKITCKNH